MKNRFVNFFLKNSNEDNDILKYGLETLYILIEKTLLLLTIAIIFNLLAELLIFLFFFSIIRSNAFGLHMNTSLKCTIVSILAFLFCTYISKFNLNLSTTLVLFALSLISIIRNAPAEVTRNLDKLKYKRKSIMLAIIFGIIMIFSNHRNLILYSLVLESILISKTIRRMKW